MREDVIATIIDVIGTLTANVIPLTAGFDKPIIYVVYNDNICIKYTYIPVCS